ncbi:MAG: hypothetical protein ABEJ89_01370 [Haloarculaceae archaeon]
MAQTAATPDSRESASVVYSVGDAQAVDIACPHCGERPIEEIARAVTITGLLLFFRVRNYRFVGCHRCVRSRLWGRAGRTLVYGWWSIAGIVGTPFVVLYDFVRGLWNRGPNANLQEALDEAGITYRFLGDRSAFDPSTHTRMELYLRGMIRLAVAVMLADGTVEAAEKDAIRSAATTLFPDYPRERVDDLIQRNLGTRARVEPVAEGLGEMLSPEGKQLAVAFVAQVAAAGHSSAADVELAGTIATAMGLDEDQVREALQSPDAVPLDPDAA